MRKKVFLLLSFVLALAVSIGVLTACGGGKKVTVDNMPETLTLFVEQGSTLRATASDGKGLTWSSGNETVATVNANGRVTGVSVGIANITATASDGKTSATCIVTVMPKITVTILDGEDAITTLALEAEESKTLTAIGSDNTTAFTWTSSNEKIATVENGVVTAGKINGTATITAAVTAYPQFSAKVEVTVAGGVEGYDITLNKGADDANAHPGTWAYWTEWGQFSELSYVDGTVTADFTENGANWYNIQLFCVNPEIDAKKYYKLTCDIDSSEAGHVTINGNVVELEKGAHSYEIYFTNGNGFSMQFGVEGGINGDTSTVIDIPAAKIVISNIDYEEDNDRVTLTAPSFTYDKDTNVITIEDNNTAGVKNYVLNLYQNGKLATGVVIEKSGDEIDWALVEGGTYQAKLKVVAKNVHYIDSAESDAQEIEVAEHELEYKFTGVKDANGVQATQKPGIWTYWSESWVTVSGEYKGGKLTVEFSNNSGNWYDTQLFYRQPGLENGKVYDLKLEIDSTAGGRVSLHGKEFTIEEGKHVYDIVFTESGGLSVQFTFGLSGQNNQQDITAATMIMEIKGVEEVEQTQLNAPSFSLADNVITIDGTANTAGVGKYELGFFQEGSDTPVKTITVADGDTIDPNAVSAGTYTVKVRAVAESLLYLDSAWSSTTATVVSESQKTPLNFSAEDAFSSGWVYWFANWGEGNVNVEDGNCYMDSEDKIHLTYTGSYWEAWGMQLFYKTGNSYTGTITIKSSVSGQITVCGQTVTLTEGETATVNVTDYISDKGSAISIQFGVDKTMLENGGTFEIGYTAE